MKELLRILPLASLVVFTAQLSVKCDKDEYLAESRGNVTIDCIASKAVHECIWVRVSKFSLKLLL